MLPSPNPLVVDTGTPPIPEAKAWLGRYDGRFAPAIDLSQAAPGDAPHPELLLALAKAAADPQSARYGPIAGDTGFRSAFAADFSAAYGATIEADEIAVTAGCNLAFVVAVMALARAGDEVILPAPWYFNHEMTLRMLGVGVAALPCDPAVGFVPRPWDAERLIGSRTRALVLVSPNNPTGAVYPPETLAAFSDLCRRRGLWLVLDETYRDFLPDGQTRAHELFAAEGWRERLIHLYSFSKAYAVPGHRLGAIVAGAKLLAETRKVLDCLQICAPRIGQVGLAATMAASASWRAEARATINRRAAAFRQAIQALPAWRIDSIGAYFAYVRHPFSGEPAARVAERLATRLGVLALPGSYFGPGQDTHLRVAFANVEADRLGEVATRLAQLSAEVT